MKLVPIEKHQFPLWKQMRTEVYSSLDDDFHDKEMEQVIEREGWFCYFLTDEGNQILGFVELSLRNVVDGCLGSPVAYLEGLYLEKEHRGRGLGKEAMIAIFGWCREKGYKELATDSELSNLNAQAFYKALGFQETYRVVEFRIDVE